MTSRPVQRRLAAILAADVAGFSALMERDEVGTFSAINARRRAIFDPTVETHQGRVVKVMGDGFLAEFTSAVNAVECAMALQNLMATKNEQEPPFRRLLLRIGINLGDIIIEDGDIFGDGVNIASRLEALAEPGSVIISAGIYDQVKRKLELAFTDLGLKALKNITEPVHVYRLGEYIGMRDATVAEPLALPAKPSIAVLPFTNLSGDPHQDAFCDGLTEDLITDLSRDPRLFVIARHSTFTYKNRAVDIRVIARELGVRFVLEGSARSAAERVRINIQLVDAVGGNHLWAERFDRNLQDIFAVQDEVIAKIVEALAGRLTSLPQRQRPASIEAYDLCVRARGLIATFTASPEATRESILLLKQAVGIDPHYAEAHRWLAFNYWQLWAHSIEPSVENRDNALASAQTAATLDPNDAGNRWALGYMLAYRKRWDESEAEFAAAFELDPNHADAMVMYSDVAALAGRTGEAVELTQRALRLNPQPAAWYLWALGVAYYADQRYEDTVRLLRTEAVYRSGSRRVLAAALAQLGRLDEARQEASLFLAKTPFFTITHWADLQPARDAGVLERFINGYRMAGLPD
ncbi:MAG: adenylate/guanylate cyclase domain-containing protein [Rhizobiaceae bacterium]